jgi:hypothetical protein
VYMVPPFIAYFGALQNDSGGQALLQTAYDQVRLYRDALFDANVSLWRHIDLGSQEDPGHWATGTQDFALTSGRRKGRAEAPEYREWLGGSWRDARSGHDQAVQLLIAVAVTTKRPHTVGRRDTHRRLATPGKLRHSSTLEVRLKESWTP